VPLFPSTPPACRLARLHAVGILLAACVCGGLTPPAYAAKPNVVLFFADDLGYGDIAPQGAAGFATPNITQLGREGTRFTHFYVAQPVCTASRAALMTGCYANRVGLSGALNHTSRTGINPDEFLLSELFQTNGYATAIFGKWHLGHQPPFLPTRNGFDLFAGLPYSNDNGPLHPVIRDIPPLPWYENDAVAETDPDQSQFTKRITARAIEFIAANKEKPFFLFLPHIMPHVPIFASKDFQGRTQRGVYGDVVEELDWSVGQIRAALKEHGVEQNTWFIFASDNGPFLSYGEHAGSSGGLREGKLTTFEGGVRVPCLMAWPGKIPAGRVSADVLTTMDLLPTVAKLIGAELPKRPIDGKNVWPIIAGEPNAKSPHEAFCYFSGTELHAIRSGPWKLHLPHEYLTVNGPPGKGGKPANYENMQPLDITESGIKGIASRHGYKVEKIELSLFNLENDPGETKNVAEAHPDIVRLLLKLADAARKDLGDTLTQTAGTGLRPVGKVE